MNAKNIVIIGASGFARELFWLIEEINSDSKRFNVLGFVVTDFTGEETRDENFPDLLGGYQWIQDNLSSVDGVAIGIGTPGPRVKVSRELKRMFPTLSWPSLIHPSFRTQRATFKPGEGIVICAGVIATVNVTIKDHAMVNLGCTLGHECVIGPCSVLNPNVNISGGANIGEGVLLGTGSQVLQYLSVGDSATVGAGAVVTKNVPPGVTVVGVPARPLIKNQ